MEDYTFPAHIRTDPETGENEIQTCTQHNQKTAAYARDALRGVGLGAAAYLAGLLHDCGKYCQQFARYLMSAVGGGDVRRGSVNHTFAGVRYILRRWHRADGATFSDIAAELLAYAAGAHHGLFDCVDSEHKSGFAHRMNSDADHTYIEDAIQNFLALCADEKQLDALFSAAFAELQKVFSVFQQLSLQSAGVSFFLGCTARLLLSAVIEGDRRDTAEFLHGAAFSGLPDDRRALWQMCL